jgi:hypothetical protein
MIYRIYVTVSYLDNGKAAELDEPGDLPFCFNINACVVKAENVIRLIFTFSFFWLDVDWYFLSIDQLINAAVQN